ncbi:MAG: hypothetical protein P4L85_10640 [Paludisphaera borealis]|uniref:hypothetical protein n=1 Tax=Paludisphaera borealis TaxID=1387353 RepID=UPI00284C6C9C|nr:hypothetical protein [Paludisphaera borealis]MDR3619795.1 hypothetical protein [Paludisphaera borealis]
MGSIAESYKEGSEEAAALLEAGHAYVFLQMHLKLKHSYENYRRLSLEGLSEMQKQHLRDMGIDPDEGHPEPDDHLWRTS